MTILSDIQQNILDWYAAYGRDLPRRRTQDPYAIHVSEVMLQQTQVDRVIPYFHTWLKKWPNYSALAAADTTELLSYRSGLGFNSRALRLRACAKEINEKLKTNNGQSGSVSLSSAEGGLDRKGWMKLPGIGPYTSAAILAFAYNIEVPVVDTNIRRVLIFLFKLDETISDKALESFAEKIIPVGRSRERHNALMDYGAMELTARKTNIRPKSKQSRFEGSDRQVRGWILKELVKNTENNLENFLLIQAIQEEFPKKNIEIILDGMVRNGLVVIESGICKIEK